MQRTLGCRHKVIEREIPVGYGIETVGRRRRRSPAPAPSCPCRWESRCRPSAAEPSGHWLSLARLHRRRRERSRESHFEIGHQVVAQSHRLGGLEMGEAGHDRVGMLASACHQRLLQRFKSVIGLVYRIAHPQPEIGRHLIVATARCVQTAPQPGRSARQGAIPVVMWISSRSQSSGTPFGLVFGGDPHRDRRAIAVRIVCLLRSPAHQAWRHAPLDAAISCRHSTLSKGIEAFISRMTADGPSSNRPPHIAVGAVALAVVPATHACCPRLLFAPAR